MALLPDSPHKLGTAAHVFRDTAHRFSRWCDCIFELARDIRSDSLRGRSAAWASNPYSNQAA
jgi:hypothetical protein